jgi:isoleucyl-tRNA synthetase
MNPLEKSSKYASRSQFIVASSRLEYLKTIIPHESITVVADSIKGSIMANHMVYRDPLQAQLRPIIHADFVSDSSGSGLVHLAPGHGMDDYILCRRHGIDAFAPVDDQGRFTVDVLPAQNHSLLGKKVQTEGNAAVLDLLRSSFEDRQPIVATHEITHRYPVDWRTKQPVMVRATEQWFADIEGIKQDALGALEKVHFVPENAKSRLESFIKGRTQWCISRQRAWGVPIPALYRIDKEPNEAIMTGATIEHIMNVIKERGIDAWWTDADNDPAWIPLDLNGQYTRGKDTMDVWFDSGTSWSLLPSSPRRPVADVYLEGSDQHRGWFQSSLLTHIAYQQSSGSTACPKMAPFGTLITHGFTLDQDGRKMSKSLGNVVSPSDIMTGTLLPPIKSKKKKGQSNSASVQPTYDAMGPDALRLWVAGSDYTKDVVIGQPVLQGVQQSLHKLRVTFKWLLGALSDFDPKTEPTISQTNGLLDRIALRKLSVVSENIHSSYASYDFSKAVTALKEYISHDLSAFYFETVKDRLYTGAKTERVSAQGTLYYIFNELLAMLAPITPLMVEEVWDFVPPQIKVSSQYPLQRTWTPFSTPATHAGRESAEELDLMLSNILAANTAIKLAQETARSKKLIGSGLESDVHLRFEPNSSYLPPTAAQLFTAANSEMLAAAFVVSKVVIDADVTPTVGASPTPDYDGQVAKEAFHLTWQHEDGEERTQSCVAYIVRPSGEKCGRCWRYLQINQEGLCGRCDDVIKRECPEKLA